MAQKFTAITCPQCGSSEHRELAEGKYQCRSCNAVFFEDKEKIEVHVNHTYNNAPPVQISKATRRKILIACFVIPILLFGISMAGSFFSNRNPHRSLLAADVYDMVNTANQTVSSAGRLLYLVPAYRHGRDDGKECLVVKAFDPQSKELISETIAMPWMSSSDFYALGYEGFTSTYTGSTLYIMAAGKLLAVDANTLKAFDKSAELSSKFPPLAAGIAKAERLYDEQGFRLRTNDALNYYYFPLQDKLYSEEEYGKARSSAPAGGKTIITYAFTGSERQELYQSVIDADANGPFGNCNSCTKSNTPFTPGRIYFNGDVPYSDAENVVVTFKTDANEKTGKVVQCLDRTGKIKWTTPAVVFAVKQWKYPFDNETKGFLTREGMLCLNSGVCSIIINMGTGKIVAQHYFSEDVFRESVK